MAFVPTEHDYQAVAGSVSNVDSNSVTFTSGRLYVVAVTSSGSTQRNCSSITNNSGVSGTWTEVNGGTDSTYTDGVAWTTTLFTSTDASGTGSIRANLSGATSASARIHIFEIPDGFDTSGMVVQSVAGSQAPTATAATCNLANSGAAANMRIAYFAHRVNEALTAANGGTLVGSHVDTTPNSVGLGLWYLTGSSTADPSVTWTTNTRGAVYMGIEVKAGSANVTVNPSTLAEVSAFPAPVIRRTPIPTALTELTAFPSPVISTQHFAINGTVFEWDGTPTTIKGLNVYGVVPYPGSGLDDQYDWFANPTNMATFAAHIASFGFNMVRLPVNEDSTNAYFDTVGDFGDALWVEGIATLVVPFGFDADNWPTASTLNDVAIDCANWLVDCWTYLGEPEWFIFDTVNEPNQGGSLTDADWLDGMEEMITIIRAGGYTGPISCEGNSWAWAYPSNVSTLLAFDDQIWMQFHRYATPDGTSQPAMNGIDDPLNNWKPEWPDQSATDGVCIVGGEIGPYNGGYGTGGSDNFANNVAGWCTDMVDEMEAANILNHCSGCFPWTWVWLDETSTPGNSMVTNTDTDWNNFVAGSTIPARNAWGTLVYGMFDTADVTINPSALASVTAFPTATKVIQKAATSLIEVTAFPAPVLVITPKPSALAEVSAFPTPTLVTSGLVVASALASITAFPSATVITGTNPVPSVLAEVTAFPTATVTTAGRVVASALATVDTLPAPTVSGNALPSPSALAEVTSFPTSIIRRTPIPSILQSITAFPTATILGADEPLVRYNVGFRITTTNIGFHLTSSSVSFRSTTTNMGFRVSNE